MRMILHLIRMHVFLLSIPVCLFVYVKLKPVTTRWWRSATRMYESYWSWYTVVQLHQLVVLSHPHRYPPSSYSITPLPSCVACSRVSVPNYNLVVCMCLIHCVMVVQLTIIM